MTTAILPVEPPNSPQYPETRELEIRLETVKRMLSEASTTVDFQQAHDAARMVDRAAAILRHHDLRAYASTLISDAERSLAKLNPGAPAGRKKKTPDFVERISEEEKERRKHWQQQLGKFRSAHRGLPDEDYETIKAVALETKTRVTRKFLIKSATEARLNAGEADATRLAGLSGIRWEGGKSVNATTGTGKWVLSLLPHDPEKTGLYCEPYAGMLSMMLNRPKTQKEYACDLNQRVIAFWETVRAHPHELREQLDDTPYAEAEFYRALAGLDDPDVSQLERTRRFCVVIGQGILSSDRANGHWAFPTDNGYNGDWPPVRRLPELSDRLRNVRLLHRPAEKTLERLEGCPHAVIYCDPPYPKVSEVLYHETGIDIERTAASLNRQEGRVAVSGNPGDWDAWLQAPQWLTLARDTYRSTPTMSNGRHVARTKNRTEVLWVNYDPETHRRLT